MTRPTGCRPIFAPLLAIAAATSMLAPAAQAAPPQQALQRVLDEWAHDPKRSAGPGVAVAISKMNAEGELEGQPLVLVSGVRDAGLKNPLQPGDAFILGSCTKSLTAVLIAHLVDERKLEWTSTLGELGDRLNLKVHPGFRKVTINDILVHRAGIPEEWHPPHANREQTVIALLARGPDSTLGEDHYSDNGFSVLGYLAEKIFNAADGRGRTWDHLVEEEIYAKLGIVEQAGASFQRGAFAGRSVKRWEEIAKTGPVAHKGMVPERGLDDSFELPSLAPAAAAQLPMGEWLKFVRFLQNGSAGKPAHNGIISDPSVFAHLFELPGKDRAGRKGYLYYGALTGSPSDYNYVGVNGGFTAFFSFQKPSASGGLAITIASNSYYSWSMGALSKLHQDLYAAWKAASPN